MPSLPGDGKILIIRTVCNAGTVSNPTFSIANAAMPKLTGPAGKVRQVSLSSVHVRPEGGRKSALRVLH